MRVPPDTLVLEVAGGAGLLRRCPGGVTVRSKLDATCFDNAASESFFATYKKEFIHTRPWNNLTEVWQHTSLRIEGYYNRRRRHSTIGYLTPVEYELGYRKLTDLAANSTTIGSDWVLARD